MAIINKSTNNECWGRYGERGTLLHCWWECRLMQPLWKAVWTNLKKLKMELPYDPMILLLGTFLKEHETLIWKNISTPMFIVALFTIARIWKQPKCPSADEWIKQLWDILCKGILRGCKKENFTLCSSIHGPWEHYAKWNKPVRERRIPFDFTHMWNLMNKPN